MKGNRKERRRKGKFCEEGVCPQYMSLTDFRQKVSWIRSVVNKGSPHTPMALEKLTDLVITCHCADAFLEVLPLFLRPLRSLIPQISEDSLDRLQAGTIDDSLIPLDNLLHSVTVSLGGIAQITAHSIITEKVQEVLRQNWIQIWHWFSFLFDKIHGILQPPTDDSQSEPIPRPWQQLDATLLFSLTLPGRIIDDVVTTPGTIAVLVDQWVLAAEDISDYDAIKPWHIAVENVGKHAPSALEDVINAINPKFATTVVQALVTCSRARVRLKNYTLILEYLKLLCQYSPKLELALVIQDSVFWASGSFRHIVSRNVCTEEDDLKMVYHCSKCVLFYLSHTFEARGHIAVVEALKAGLLLAIVRAIPWFFHTGPRPDSKLFEHYFTTVLDHIGSQTVYHSVLKVLSSSMRLIEAKGYEQYLEQAPYHLRWSRLKKKVEELTEIRKTWKLHMTQPCPACEKTLQGPVIVHCPPYRCSQCLRIYYCSEKCQKKDWENHQNVCKKAHDDRARGVIPPLDPLDASFKLWLKFDYICRVQYKASKLEQNYRTNHPYYPRSQPLIHVLHFDTIPMDHRLATILEARLLAPRENWEKAVAKAMAHRQRLFIAIFMELGEEKTELIAKSEPSNVVAKSHPRSDHLDAVHLDPDSESIKEMVQSVMATPSFSSNRPRLIQVDSGATQEENEKALIVSNPSRPSQLLPPVPADPSAMKTTHQPSDVQDDPGTTKEDSRKEGKPRSSSLVKTVVRGLKVWSKVVGHSVTRARRFVRKLDCTASDDTSTLRSVKEGS
ncbi:hypothetical protein D9758_007436 [Tetrapyrgos nigripes]|uniref:MYND-type domain-containing protein n=1 Tax=Tetrapyrgos nigripes TaxID=182062 RepID=A0A8H5G396_9AGAR|nr:hypothetical protein D9758_007436 [Tetrapyrgos nigripes]